MTPTFTGQRDRRERDVAGPVPGRIARLVERVEGETIARMLVGEGPAAYPDTLERAKGQLQMHVQWVLDSADVGVWFRWKADGEPTVSINGLGGLGAVARQLPFVVARFDGFEICSGCGEPYAPNRKPRANARRWCPDCRGSMDRQAANRDYKRRRLGGLRKTPT